MLNFITRLRQFDFASETIDPAIHFGQPQWSGAELELICGETLVPVCSPALARRHEFHRAIDVRRHRC